MDIEKLKKQADWSSVEKRPTWGTVTSRELSEVLGVSIQTINNWHIRGHLPKPEPHKRGWGNKNRYRISLIKNWLYGTPEEKIHWEFIDTHMFEGFKTLEQAQYYAERDWRAFGIEPKR